VKGYTESEKHRLSAVDLILWTGCEQTESEEGDIGFSYEKEQGDYFSTVETVEIKNGQIHFSSEHIMNLPDIYTMEDIYGAIYIVNVKKDTLGKTVHINEPIKTDKFTQRNITVPNKGKVIVSPNSECKFSDEDELNQAFGEIMEKIKKLPPDYDFKVRSPQAVLGVRGTQFITRVEKDGTTILTVLDGEVEFSDKKKRKTVVVKKNQISVVNPGGLPSDPVSIDPNQILRWWE